MPRRGAREPRAPIAAAHRRRRSARPRVVATANYVARGFRHPFGDERRRGDPALPARGVRPARHALYREYSRHVWSTVRGWYRPSSRPDSTRATSISARWRVTSSKRASSQKRFRHPSAARRASPAQWASLRARSSRRSGAMHASRAARGRRSRSRGEIPCAARRPKAPGRRPEGRNRCVLPESSRSAGLRRCRTATYGGSCPARSARCCATALAASIREDSSTDGAHLDQRGEHVRARPRRARASVPRAARNGA